MSKLTCTKGNNKHDEFALHEGKNILGRSKECQITLFDKKCSRQHCQIIKKGQHYCIQDLDSSNGTLLNGKPVPQKAKTCRIGDVVTLGKTRLKLSDKAVGNVINQAATDVAADLQNGKYGDLLSTTTQYMRDADKEETGGFRKFLRSLFDKK